jgi:tetratricopeptide (TPR) repeat protein
VWVLAGVGGIGKSTVALKVAGVARRQGWRVWWVGASDTASLTGGILEILYQLQAPVSVIRPVQEGAATAVDRTWEFLARAAGRRWLLVFDNADTPAVLAGVGATSPADGNGWLRLDLSGVVVVTTRVRDPRTWGAGAVLRELRALDDADAAKVLRDLAPRIVDETGQQARELGYRLGGLPLALHLAGAYLASPFASWNSFAAYRQALDSVDLVSAVAALDDAHADPRDTILRSWELSLDALAAQGVPQARWLLYLLSCYAATFPISRLLVRPETLIEVAQSEGIRVEPGKDAAAGEKEWLSRGLVGLSGLGLIDSESSTAAITVHPAVADSCRTRMLTASRSELPGIGSAAVRLLEEATAALDSSRPADWPTWQSLIPHIDAPLAWLGAYLEASTLAALMNLAAHAGDAMVRSANYATAGELARAMVTVAVNLPYNHPATLASRHLLAQVIEGQGHYREAERQYREVLAVERHVLGKGHTETLATCHDLAHAIVLQLRWGEAESLYREVLAARQLALGADHPDTLITRNDLAWAVFAQHRWGEAEPMYREVLAARQRVLGADHPDTLATRNDLAWAIAWQGRNSEAEQRYREILIDRRRVLGADHPDTLATRNDLAWAIAEQGRYGEAEPLYREVLADRRRVLGDDHPATLATHHNLAWVITQEGRYKDAESLYREELTARRTVLGDDHLDTLATRHNLAEVILKQGHPSEAETLLAEVLTVRRTVLGDNDPATLATREALDEATTLRRNAEAATTTDTGTRSV